MDPRNSWRRRAEQPVLGGSSAEGGRLTVSSRGGGKPYMPNTRNVDTIGRCIAWMAIPATTTAAARSCVRQCYSTGNWVVKIGKHNMVSLNACCPQAYRLAHTFGVSPAWMDGCLAVHGVAGKRCGLTTRQKKKSICTPLLLYLRNTVGNWCLILSGLQSRFGDKLLTIWVACPDNGTAVIKAPKSAKDLAFCLSSYYKKLGFKHLNSNRRESKPQALAKLRVLVLLQCRFGDKPFKF